MNKPNCFAMSSGLKELARNEWIRFQRRTEAEKRIALAARRILSAKCLSSPFNYQSRAAFYRHCKKLLMKALAPYWQGSRAALKARVRAYLAPRRKKVRFLSGILRAAAIPGSLAILMIVLSSPAAHAERSAAFAAGTNPLNGVDVGNFSHITLADLDGDGDSDAVTGSEAGTFRYYENTGTPIAPVFTERTSGDNPLDGFYVGSESTPFLADLDGDGDADLVSGVQTGLFTYFENTGSATTPAFTERTGGDNPLDGFDVGSFSRPGAVDVDGDGDWDIFSGEGAGTIKFYENTGTAVAPAFTERTGAANPFDGIDVGSYSATAFADLDEDGDPDAIIGTFAGTIRFFENTGTAVAPVFADMTGAANPFDGIDVGAESRIALADLDGDGDLDAFSGDTAGTFTFFVNSGVAFSPLGFAEQVGGVNPFDGEVVGNFANPALVDADGDGDFDLFAGERLGAFVYYENTGTAIAPAFTEQVGGANPFGSFDAGFSSAPVYADIDADGDPDAVVGSAAGTIQYFENTGTALAPVYVEQAGGSNPFNGATVLDYVTLALVDMDGDGDLDAVAGSMNTVLTYFENTGTATAPAFSEQIGAGDPFDGIAVIGYATPWLLDADGDGDFDALVGGDDGTITYIENTGTVLAPVMMKRSSGAIPFIGLDLGNSARPTCADLNSDGYPDAVVGLGDGTLNYFIGGITPTLDANTGITLDEGATLAVTTTELSATDEDSTDSTLAFTVTPSNGQFENTDSPGNAITTFTQQDLIDGKIQYVHDGSNTTSDTVGVEVSDGTFALVGQTFIVTINPIDDTAPTIAVNTGMTLSEGATKTITTAMLSATDADSNDAALSFTVTVGTANGQLENTDSPGNPVTTFTQQDLLDGKIQYIHDGSNTTSDAFTFSAADGIPNPLTGQIFAITVTPVDDDPPTLTINAGLTVNEGATGTISSVELSATDTESTVSQLAYTVTTGPANGQVENIDSPGTPITTFIQQDLQNGKIVYVHDDSNTTSDSFTFSVADSAANQLAGQMFDITINPVDDDAPTLAVNTGTSLNEGATTILTPAQLSATDADSVLTFTVTTAPTNGQLENTDAPGTPISAFTQQDVIDGKVRYAHDGSDTTDDSFTFSVSDSVPNTLAGQIFVFTINPVDDAIPALTVNTGITLLEGETRTITTSELSARDPDSIDGALVFTLTSGPSHGRLENTNAPGISITTFIQQNLNDGKIRYVHDGSDSTGDGFTFTIADGVPNTSTVQFFSITIVPVDNVAPVLTLNGANPLTLECGIDNFDDPGYSAVDDVDGVITGSVAISGDTVDASTKGSYSITYTATDTAGNTTQRTRVVNVIDTTAPALTLTGDNPLELELGANYAEPGAAATDACDGDLTASIQITGTVDTGVAGDYVRVYTVTDMSGNTAQLNRTITVRRVAADNNADGVVNAIDVQRVINAVLGLLAEDPLFDANGDSAVNAVDIQVTINAALGL